MGIVFHNGDVAVKHFCVVLGNVGQRNAYMIDDAMEMDETWADRARLLMRRKRITQAALAEMLEMSQGGLSKWLNGEREPSLQGLTRIAKHLGTSPRYLIFGPVTDEDVEEMQDVLKKILAKNK